MHDMTLPIEWSLQHNVHAYVHVYLRHHCSTSIRNSHRPQTYGSLLRLPTQCQPRLKKLAKLLQVNDIGTAHLGLTVCLPRISLCRDEGNSQGWTKDIRKLFIWITIANSRLNQRYTKAFYMDYDSQFKVEPKIYESFLYGLR